MATIPRMGKVPAIATYAATGIAFGVVTTVWRHIEKGAPLGALLSLEALARTTFAAVFFAVFFGVGMTIVDAIKESKHPEQ
jgi:ABC-type phosphate transport system permease subunit